MAAPADRKLTLTDIADLRAYERERDSFRQHVKALKQRRRIGVGPLVTLVFENRDTVRFQVQEMARIERIISDAGIQTELDAYNPLIPDPGQLSATLFVELASEEQLRAWLPRLVGIERAAVLRFGGLEARCVPEAVHDQHLTRDDITSSVHYVRWELTADQVRAFAGGPVELAIDHPAYQHAVLLRPDVVAELLRDLEA